MNKKIVIALALFLLLTKTALRQPKIAQAQEQRINIYLFYSVDCPYCRKEKSFLENKIAPQYPEVALNLYAIDDEGEGRNLLMRLAKEHGNTPTTVPITFIGDEMLVGFRGDYTTGVKIEKLINNCLTAGCQDPLTKELYHPSEKKEASESSTWVEPIKVPLLGQIDPMTTSLPVLTVILGLMDGFNPCAMWVLTFLIALLVNTKSRKKMWQIGGTFIIVSGIVYFLFMSAWLNVFLLLGFLDPIRIIVGIGAIATGIYHLKEFKEYEEGVCRVSRQGNLFNIKNKAKKLVQAAMTPATFIGVAGLAFAVNLVELICSAGLPAIYTKVLSMSNLAPPAYYGYLALYTILYMLDDTIIFAIAVKTLSLANFSGKFSRWSLLIGGLLIMLLGTGLIFAPGMLTFH